MAAAFDRDFRVGDELLAVRLPSGTAITEKMKNICSELGGVSYNYQITENFLYVYAYPRTDDDLKWPYIQEIIETAKEYSSDRERAEYLAETICDRLEYAYDRNINSWSKAMESGGKAVCSGYAAAFQRMGRAAGLDVLTVGSAAGNHAWNIVCYDGEWLTVDLTHYDTSHNEVNWFQQEHPKMKPDGLDEINFVKSAKEKSIGNLKKLKKDEEAKRVQQ
ncbi:hypothetical protein D7X33_42315, partial [Butyricicoccus sp. 1XD8-22]